MDVTNQVYGLPDMTNLQGWALGVHSLSTPDKRAVYPFPRNCNWVAVGPKRSVGTFNRKQAREQMRLMRAEQ